MPKSQWIDQLHGNEKKNKVIKNKILWAVKSTQSKTMLTFELYEVWTMAWVFVVELCIVSLPTCPGQLGFFVPDFMRKFRPDILKTFAGFFNSFYSEKIPHHEKKWEAKFII